MTTHTDAGGTPTLPVVPLLRAAHIGPSVAVTVVVVLLAVSTDIGASTVGFVTAGVFAGQLTIGWGNDLVDRGRDRAVGRTDKPLAIGLLSPRLVVVCLVVAAVACIVFSFLAGWRSGLVHVFVGVASGHAYNLGVKATAWSWLPYALAFGTLPAVVTLAGDSPDWPPGWMVVTAAALGVAAHFLNTLPDLDDDAVTGVRGLPHRLGPRITRILGTVLLVIGSVVAVLGPSGGVRPVSLAVLVVVLALGVVALAGRGKVPFYAAIAIALLDVALLTVGAG